ncbi:MAG: hypothetical protein UR69_C0001G0293 [Candidatus Moranbacteria bacterium GW2011_GWE2_35_2-]|nr:MAG: hypothetical protein UR69_C0001G0293 [Candidatus Moranbacteria bacterium GW2011_GWE2_35_2-]KKQ21822.1 MAG: hypothetical protein US37_C0007G0020 [Candidatus Moranbacteria bacterium GW2011_GWF2_37_11]KKQ28863.1 MAG: hypothetical protein US44_C0005G0005 [Candidatus Moranbacteria bacterium GW2011_GWD1_37_17]KKQ31060.1 MAG: hypothetical protein US47_C0001G0293 [Candidatus Moranbacteria bacterium GW2011_GWE1_37_24]KKQ48123.1 MAG: hypothetical protein US66_C0002G0067 [Candidatus Moranbacteria 
MKKTIKIFFLTLLVFCGVILKRDNVLAEDFYVGFGQGGDGSGISCETAKPYEFFNDNSNCGTGDGKISSGDTVFLCDDTGEFTETLVTPYSCNGFTIKSALGETPLFDVALGNALNFPNIGKSNIVIDGLTFSGWEDGKSAIYFVDAVGPIEIKNSKFTKSDAEIASYAVNFYIEDGAGGAVGNVDIHDNEFFLNSKVEGIRMGIFTSSTMARVHDVNVHHNKFSNVDKAFRFFMSTEAQSWVPAQGLRPYNIKFDDNEVHTSNAAAVGTAAGITEISGTSSVSRNIITDCGSPDQIRVNCLQLHWVDGVDIVDNVINGVDTATCDGDGIILDWTISNDAYISTNNNVLRNRISNANALCGGRCISIFKGSGNLVANNFCNGTSADGLKIGSNEGAGNIFYNNTVTDVVNCFSLSDGDNIGVPESIWKNNICSQATGYGFKVINNSIVPTESHNLFYDIGLNDIVLDGSDLIHDPKLFPDGTLESDSPAIDAGTDVGFLYSGNAPDIGAFEYTSENESCSDNIQNQDETGIDCGGVCEACVVPITYGLSNFISAITNWLGIGNETSDVNSDGVVNTRDLGVVMSNWGN